MKAFWNKLKRQWRKVVFWSALLIISIFIIPIVINFAYSRPAVIPLFAMDWEAKDVLSFYGSLLGAAATIYVLYKTINFTINNQKEERKLSVKPYLETKKYCFTDVFSLSKDDDIVYIEISKKGPISQIGALPSDIEDLHILWGRLKNQICITDVEQAQFDNHVKEFFEKNYVLYYEISNYGAGNAINVLFSINEKYAESGFCVSLDKPKRFVLIMKKDLLEGENTNELTLKLSLVYSDIISSTRYFQEEELYFSVTEDKENTMDNLDLVGHFIAKSCQMSEEKYNSYKKRKKAFKKNEK